MNPLPSHVAVIMDGNGRWAGKRGLPRTAGHEEGVKRTREIVRVAGEMGIKYLTLYTFSDENWNRPNDEVEFLMNVLAQKMLKETPELKQNNVKIRVIGNIAKLPEKLQKSIEVTCRETENCTGLTLVLALSYSSRQEILRAVRSLAQDMKTGKVSPDAISEELFANRLDTAGIPDPDLLIRTSGEYRISNFLLWQISYSELYITETLWPDFGKDEFLKAIEEYGKRERRFGLTEAHR